MTPTSSLSEPFHVLSEEDVIILIDSLQKNLPDSYHALGFAMNIVNLKKAIDLKGEIYAPYGDYTDCTILILIKFQGEFSGTYYSSSESGCSRLKNALNCTHLFNDSNCVSLLITAVHDRVYRQVGTEWCKMELFHVTPCNLYSMTQKDGEKLKPVCPEGFEVRPLKEEDAELINSVWPHRSDHSLSLMKQIIQSSNSAGLYRKHDNKLLSWVIKWFYGGCGVLQTLEEAKRKGYAKIVISSIVSQFVEDNWPIHATVLIGNRESTPLFDRMGFQQQFLCHYIEFFPKKI